MSGRELVYLLIWPVFTLVVGMAASWFLGVYIPRSFVADPMLESMANALSGYAPPVFHGTWILTLLLLAWSGLRFWWYASGRGPMCDRCGGMQVDRNGRYGPYWQCLRCGANEKQR